MATRLIPLSGFLVGCATVLSAAAMMGAERYFAGWACFAASLG
jgi:hypothetical protein